MSRPFGKFGLRFLLPMTLLVLGGALFALPGKLATLEQDSAKQGSPGRIKQLLQGIVRLSRPGPLGAAHAEFDNAADCGLCHAPSGLQAEKCLACHEEIKLRMDQQSGYHGMLSDECWNCHLEHRGRDFELTSWDAQAFNHQLANFPLLGAHQTLACPACHDAQQAGSRQQQLSYYIGAPQQCVQCHADPHQGQLSQTCETCHNERSWTAQDTGFDHALSRYPLTGKHLAVECAACHSGGQYLFQSFTCRDCHEDLHNGQFEQACETCHVTAGWSEDHLLLDHAQCRFPLLGRHQAVQCAQCHEDGQYKFDELNCSSCHEDPHEGQFAQSCESCHTADGWVGGHLTFDHQRDSSYPLTGGHLSVSCTECHQDGKFALSDSSCIACHEDPHEGQFAQSCESCHTADGWVGGHLTFNHQRDSSYPLTGGHLGVSCAECHQDGKFSLSDSSCIACHENPHDQAVSEDCAKCHDTGPWKTSWQRLGNHDDTQFPLDLMHQSAQCTACHEPGTLKTLGTECATCHSDVQDFRAGRSGSWPVVGAKPDPMFEKVKCQDCHTATDAKAAFKDILPRCETCHTPAYGAFALEWMILTREDAKSAMSRLGDQPPQAARKAVTDAVRLAPHNFNFARRLLNSIGQKQSSRADNHLQR